ncbi:hypothetical protein CDH54_01505 [Escherichia coli]|nr:hypothetical protein CDH54_01505 [Escherichia coli]
MLPSETMIWQPEFTDKTLSRKPGAVQWLAIQSASQKWTMPLQDWRIVMSRFIIEFGDRPDGHF